MNCKHKWVAMEDGSLRKFCVRCAKFGMQAVATVPNEININIAIENAMREPTTVDSIAEAIKSQLERGVRLKGMM